MKVAYTGSVDNTGVWTEENLPKHPFLLITEEGSPLLIIVNYIMHSERMRYTGYSPKEGTVTRFTVEGLLVEMNKPLAGLRKANIRGEVRIPIEAKEANTNKSTRNLYVDEKPFFLNVEVKGLTLFAINKVDTLEYIGYSLNSDSLWSIRKTGLAQWVKSGKYQSLENLTIEISDDVILPASE